MLISRLLTHFESIISAHILKLPVQASTIHLLVASASIIGGFINVIHRMGLIEERLLYPSHFYCCLSGTPLVFIPQEVLQYLPWADRSTCSMAEIVRKLLGYLSGVESARLSA